LIFSVFKIASFPHTDYKYNCPCHCYLIYLFTFAINLWQRIFITAWTSLQCLSTINMVWSDEVKILIKKTLYLKEYTAKRLTDEFPEKRWTKLVVHKLLKKLRDTGTVDRRSGSRRPHSEKKIAAFVCLIFQILC